MRLHTMLEIWDKPASWPLPHIKNCWRKVAECSGVSPPSSFQTNHGNIPKKYEKMWVSMLDSSIKNWKVLSHWQQVL